MLGVAKVLGFFIIGLLICTYIVQKCCSYYKVNNYQNSVHCGIDRKILNFYTQKDKQKILQILKIKRAEDLFKYEIKEAEDKILLNVLNITKNILWKPDKSVVYELSFYRNEDRLTQLYLEVVDYDSWWAMTEYGSIMGEFLNEKIGLI